MIWILENENLIVKVTDDGGALTSIQNKENNLEYLWQKDADFWTGQAPVLFPICGSIRNDEATLVDGTKTKMPRHGIVRKKQFKLENVTRDEVCVSIESTKEMKEIFPYYFKLFITYTLRDKTIETKYRVVNFVSDDMPFFIGGHPGFKCPIVEGEDYSDYYVEFEKKETCTVPTPVTENGLIDMEHRTSLLKDENVIPLAHELFHKDAIILDELESRKVSLKNKKDDIGVELDFEEFPYLILWSSPNDGNFIAMEPWSGLSTCSDEPDEFEKKRNVKYAVQNEPYEMKFNITIL